MVYSYQKEEPEDELVAAVQEKLLVDLKHIKSMITARKNGDFALNERNYMRYLDNKLYDKKDISGPKENNLGYYNQLVLEDFNEKYAHLKLCLKVKILRRKGLKNQKRSIPS